MDEEKEMFDDKEMKNFFKDIQNNLGEIEGSLIRFGRFYQLYNENPPASMALLYDEIYKLHEALLGTFLQDSVESFEKIQKTMAESFSFLAEMITKVDANKLREDTKERFKFIKENLKEIKKHYGKGDSSIFI